MNAPINHPVNNAGLGIRLWRPRALRSDSICLVALICCGTAISDTWAIASFQGLSDLPGGSFSSSALAVSGDGLIVVGDSSGKSFQWTSPTGMVELGIFPDGAFTSGGANALSSDGSILAGSGISSFGVEAFRWTATDGVMGLGDLPGGVFASNALSISSDGSVVAGWSATGPSTSTDREAFRWTSVDGMVSLGIPLASQGTAGVSGNGQIIFGTMSVANHGVEAFIWSNATGITALGDLRDGPFVTSSLALDVSVDGATVVGAARSNTQVREAFRWTEISGMVSLGTLPGFEAYGHAFGVSADGSVIIGQNLNIISLESRAFIWDPVQGIQDLNNVLTNLGLDLTGWTLTNATGISDDGLTIVGTGINPNGDTEAFIATLPEPGALAVMGLGLLMLGRRRC